MVIALTIPKVKTKIISISKLSWIDHAERHHNNGYSHGTNRVSEVDSHLMYLCLFSHVGMFE